MQHEFVVNGVDEAVSLVQRITSGENPISGDSHLGGESPTERALSNDRTTITGFPSKIEKNELENMWSRTIGGVIVDRPPHDTWREGFKVIMPTPKEEQEDKEEEPKLPREIEILNRNIELKKMYNLADTMQRLDGFSIIFIGVREKGSEPTPLEEEVPANNVDGIEFLRVYRKPAVKAREYIEDTESPDFGKLEKVQITVTQGKQDKDIWLHASRLIILSEKNTGDPFDGISCLIRPYDYLLSLENVIWATAEAQFQRVVPIFVVSYDDTPSPEDQAKIDTQLDEFRTGVRQRFQVSGLTIEPLVGSSKIQNIKHIYDSLIDLVAGASGIPKRVITGSQAGALASSQTDKEEYYAWIGGRQDNFAESTVRDLYDRAQSWKILPDGEYDLIWNPLFELSDVSIAELKLKRADALIKLTGGKSLPFDNEALVEEFLNVDPKIILVQPEEGTEESPTGQPGGTVAPEAPAEGPEGFPTPTGQGPEDAEKLKHLLESHGFTVLSANQKPARQNSPEEQEQINKFGFLLERSVIEQQMREALVKVINQYQATAFKFLEENIRPELSGDQASIVTRIIKRFNQAGELNLNPKKMEKTVLEFTTAAFQQAGQNAAGALGTTLTLGDPTAVAWLQRNALIIGETVTKEIERDIRLSVAESLRSGEGWGALKTRVAKDFEKHVKRPDVLARTETQKATSEGTITAYKDLGVQRVRWLTIMDDRTDAECIENNGKLMTLEEASGQIPIHPNCRCTWVPVGPTGEVG